MKTLKGRATCPKCNNSFILDIPKDNEKHEVVCPKCKNKFNIKTKSKPSTEKDCSWEEHGEPRKTILSAIKPKTNKPMIAAILLICVFSLGITTAVFSETFIESTYDAASAIGLKGTVEVTVINKSSNQTVDNVVVKVYGETLKNKGNGLYKLEDVELGLHYIEIKGAGYKTVRQEILVSPFFLSEHEININPGSEAEKEKQFDTMGCTIIILIFSVFAFVGIITCIKRQNFDVAVAGSIFGIFCFGFFFIGSILSIVAFVLIYKSRDEFENGKKGKIF